jgi:hypothetical protein
LTGSEFISESSGGIPLFSFPQKCKSGTEAVQGVRRLVGSSELVNQREELKDYCRKELHRVKEFKYLDVFEECRKECVQTQSRSSLKKKFGRSEFSEENPRK